MKLNKICFIALICFPVLALGVSPDGRPHYFDTRGDITFEVDQWYLQLSREHAVTCEVTVLNDIQPYEKNTVNVSLDTSSYHPAEGADTNSNRVISQRGYYYFYQNKPIYERGRYYSYFNFDFSPTQENPTPKIKISCNLP